MTEIQFPISIALIGAPGSGKAAVMEAFAEGTKDDPFWDEQTLCVIGNTGAMLADDYDVPMGLFGDYKENLAAHYLRYFLEQGHLGQGESIITAGTVIENMAHGGVKIEDIRGGLQTPDMEMRLMKEMHTTTVLSFLFADTFRYTFGFYLPLPETTLTVVGGDGGERAHATRVDQALRVIFGNFGVRIQVLEKGSPEEKADEMARTIQRIMTDGPDTPDVTAEEPAPPVEVDSLAA